MMETCLIRQITSEKFDNCFVRGTFTEIFSKPPVKKFRRLL
jgi:hypothetical protein